MLFLSSTDQFISFLRDQAKPYHYILNNKKYLVQFLEQKKMGRKTYPENLQTKTLCSKRLAVAIGMFINPNEQYSYRRKTR